MVTRAGKDLLKNTIRSTDHHNKLMQEEDMWRQWEIEKGLTMMVTDDSIRNRLRMDYYRKSDERRGRGVDTKQLQRQKEAARESRRGNYWSRKLMEAEENDPDRWGHSGYRELYPDEFQAPPSSSSKNGDVRDRSKRKNHKKHKRKHKRKQKKGSNDEDEPETPKPRENNNNNNHHHHHTKCKSESSIGSQTVLVVSDDDQQTDPETCQSLSAISASELARRREYLKRKLEEFSQESSTSSEEEDQSPSEQMVIFKSKKRTAHHQPPKRLQSQVVMDYNNSKKTKFK